MTMLTGFLDAVLDLPSPAVIGFVGAGGKTTLLYRLAGEVAHQGKGVLITTTTKMRLPASWQADQVAFASALEAAREQVRAAVAPGKRIFLARAPLPGGKVDGIPPAWVDVLAADGLADAILVEADGAAGRPLKGAYAAHEPCVPGSSGLVVCVAGINVLDKPLTAEWVHRAEILLAEGDYSSREAVITAGVMARTLHGIAARAAQQAPGARLVFWLNKVEAPGDLATARVVARQLSFGSASNLQLPISVFLEPVVLGAAAARDPVREVWRDGCRAGAPPVAGVILAAGLSTRLPGKLFLPLGEKTVIEHAVDNALGSCLGEIIVVGGYRVEELRRALADRPLRLLENLEYASGQATSLRAGLAAVSPGTAAVMFLLGDQPFVSPAIIDRLVTVHCATGAWITYPVYAGRRGNPVIFARELLGELWQAGGDQGGRWLVEKYQEQVRVVEVNSPGVILDVDTPEDYRRAQAILQDGSSWYNLGGKQGE